MTYRNASRTRNRAAAQAAVKSVVETLEGRTLLSASVGSFTLIDAKSDTEIMTLNAGATLNLATLPSRELNIRANASSDTNVVKFALDKSSVRTEKSAPFAFAGDKDGNYKSWTPSLGSHTLKATPFADGAAGSPLSVSFNVVNEDSVQPAPNPDPTPTPTPEPTTPQVARFILVNADTDKDIYTLTDGATLDLSTLPTRNLTARAELAGGATSVRFSLDGVSNYQTENIAPYVINGDNNGNMSAWSLGNGAHNITGVAFNGSQVGGTLGVNFTIVNGATTPTPTPTPTPDPDPTPNPTPGGKPGAHNTGPTNTSILRKVSGGFTVTQDGAVIENVDVDGDIQVKASNVTIRNFKATGIKFYDEAKYGSHRNLLVEDGEITDPTSGTGIIGGHMTVRRVEIHHMGADGINVHANAIIENCYIHHLGMADGSHADAISGSSQDGKPVLGVVIRNNNFDIPSSVDRGQQGARPEYNGYRSNGVIFVGQFGTKDNPMIVEGNYLNGGNYTVSSGIKGAVIVYKNNRFGDDYNWGLRKTHSGETWESGTWVGNVMDATGKAV